MVSAVFREADEAFERPAAQRAGLRAGTPSPDVAAVEAMVVGIGDSKLAEATKRAALAAKTGLRPSRENR